MSQSPSMRLLGAQVLARPSDRLFRTPVYRQHRRNATTMHIRLGRGVIGSTTDSGSVSWGSSPCAPVFLSSLHDERRKGLLLQQLLAGGVPRSRTNRPLFAHSDRCLDLGDCPAGVALSVPMLWSIASPALVLSAVQSPLAPPRDREQPAPSGVLCSRKDPRQDPSGTIRGTIAAGPAAPASSSERGRVELCELAA